MSALSLLAFVTGLAAKVRPPTPDVEITKLKARVEELDNQVRGWMRLTESWRERAEDWRRRAQLTARERYDLELQDRAMRLHDLLLRVRTQQGRAQQGLAQQDLAQQQMALAQQQIALAQQQPMGLAYMGQEAQAMWCNCVPSRSQMWAETQRRNALIQRSDQAQAAAAQNLERALSGPIERIPAVLLDALTDTPSSRQGD
jgi:hypothetical protein